MKAGKYDLDLPPDWDFIARVTPLLDLRRPGAMVANGYSLADRGLSLLEIRSEDLAYALTGGMNLHSKTGLRLPLSPEAWERAKAIRLRWSRNLAPGTVRRWTDRRILLSGIYITAGHEKQVEALIKAAKPT